MSMDAMNPVAMSARTSEFPLLDPICPGGSTSLPLHTAAIVSWIAASVGMSAIQMASNLGWK